ncbi:netrin receptor UNC5B, partial [Eurytemora carolleeae]|uniref:netrin receptor UNC5B n=1 Tax=Eurytemora carolleeae TaxID=1294199 RepID=UPI000C761026
MIKKMPRTFFNPVRILVVFIFLHFYGISVKTAIKDDGMRGFHPNDILGLPPKPTKPVFLAEPQDGYIVKSRSAVLNCTVIHGNKAYFSCNGEALAKSVKHSEQDLVDADTGEIIRILTIEITREQ